MAVVEQVWSGQSLPAGLCAVEIWTLTQLISSRKSVYYTPFNPGLKAILPALLVASEELDARGHCPPRSSSPLLTFTLSSTGQSIELDSNAWALKAGGNINTPPD